MLHTCCVKVCSNSIVAYKYKSSLTLQLFGYKFSSVTAYLKATFNYQCAYTMCKALAKCPSNKQSHRNAKLYVWLGILTKQHMSHVKNAATPVLLRCTSGLAQSFSLTTPISLTRRCGLSPTLAAPSLLFKRGTGGNPGWQG